MFDLQGHRGARGLFAENTLEGFRAALALGVDSVELDVAVTADGVAVVHHDPALNPDLARTETGAWIEAPGPLIRSLTLSALRRFDVGRVRPGSETAARFPGQRAMDGARVPTLVEVLALPGLRHVNIELKLMPDAPERTVGVAAMVGCVLEAIDAAGAAGFVTVQSFDWRAPRLVRRMRPALACGWLTEAGTIAAAPVWRGVAGASTALADVPAAIAAEGGGTWTPFHAELTPELVATAHELGLRVIPWTVNEAADMRRLTGWGVDGLITDYPDRALPLVR